MRPEEKQLLLQDLCARLPYGVCVELPNHHLVKHIYSIKSISMENGVKTILPESKRNKFTISGYPTHAIGFEIIDDDIDADEWHKQLE